MSITANTGFFAGPQTLGAANTPVSVQSFISSAVKGVPCEVFIVPDGTAGNLVLTGNSAATGESDGIVLFDTLPLRSMSISDAVQAASIYLISATASKTFGLIVRSR